MDKRRAVQLVAAWWAVTGVAVAAFTSSDVNDDAEVLVAGAHAVGFVSAVVAAWLLARGRGRGAGALLVLSAIVTPTYFAWLLNLPALVAGIVLVATPRLLPRRQVHA